MPSDKKSLLLIIAEPRTTYDFAFAIDKQVDYTIELSHKIAETKKLLGIDTAILASATPVSIDNNFSDWHWGHVEGSWWNQSFIEMGNFDEDIKRIANEMLEDGTIEEIIKAKVKESFEKAVADSFRWGELSNAIDKRIKSVLVPYIENVNLDDYIVKLDTILAEIVNNTALQDNKKILENFKELMIENPKEIALTDIFEAYKKFVAANMEINSREVSFDSGEPEYEPIEVEYQFASDLEERRWSIYKYATVDFIVNESDQENELNKTIRLRQFEEYGWEIVSEPCVNIDSLRNMSEFEVLLHRLSRVGTKIIIDRECDDDIVYSDEKPEPTY